MTEQQTTDNVIIIGAGIMGATMGTLLKQLEPEWDITVLDKSDRPGKESSNEWNNAGTGHAALCELNYTTEQADGSIDISKAININEQFQVSKQFWAHLVDNQEITNPEEFIRPLPHISFVHKAKDVDFLKRRYEAMAAHPMFENIEYTEDRIKLAEWIPLMMEGRPSDEPVAGSKINSGTDVNFGELTRKLMHNLEAHNHVNVQFKQEVLDFNQMEDGTWEVKIRNYEADTLEYRTANFVFIGAGGDAIPLLQKTNIPESKHIGGFPISGEFLTCTNPDVVNKHHAKVYGKEPEGKPPMTVPHLDRRYIDNQNMLLFGPFAGFGPKFLKNGSNMDIVRSIQPDNILTLLAAGAKNIPLIQYSINQALLSKQDRMNELRKFIPDAKDEDWQLIVAGKRVQVIRDTEESGKGTIQFGTEVVQSEDHTLAALLGESPGASTSVSIMLDVLNNNFPEHMKAWEPKLKAIIPSYGESLAENPELLQSVHEASSRALKLEDEEA